MSAASLTVEDVALIDEAKREARRWKLERRVRFASALMGQKGVANAPGTASALAAIWPLVWNVCIAVTVFDHLWDRLVGPLSWALKLFGPIFAIYWFVIWPVSALARWYARRELEQLALGRSTAP